MDTAQFSHLFSLSEQHLKWRITDCLHLNHLQHKPQQNCLKSVCTSWWCCNSFTLQKRIGHSLQTYDFTPWCRSICIL